MTRSHQNGLDREKNNGTIKNSDIEKQIILNLTQSLNKTIPGLLTWNEIDCTQ